MGLHWVDHLKVDLHKVHYYSLTGDIRSAPFSRIVPIQVTHVGPRAYSVDAPPAVWRAGWRIVDAVVVGVYGGCRRGAYPDLGTSALDWSVIGAGLLEIDAVLASVAIAF